MKKYLGLFLVLGLFIGGASRVHAFNFAGLQKELTASAINSIQSIATKTNTPPEATPSVLSLKTTDTATQIKAIQQELFNKGYLTKKEYITGYLGPITNDAFQQYKANQGKAKTASSNDSGNRAPLSNPPAPTVACTVTVTSPNGGEVFTAGQQVMMTWTSTCPTTDQIQVRLYNQALQGMNISPVTPNFTGSPYVVNDGSELMTIPVPAFGSMPPLYGLHYKIRMIDTTSGGVYDYSNNMFTINAPTVSCAVYSPTTGQPYITYVKNTAYPDTTVAPNGSHVKIGSFTLQNLSTCESIRVTNATVGVMLAGGVPMSDLNGLSLYVDGTQYGSPMLPSSTNSFALASLIVPSGTHTFEIYADLGATASGTIQTTFVPNSIGVTTNQTYSPIGSYPTPTGQLITIANCVLNTPTLVTSSSTPSQYIASANGAPFASVARYNFTATGCSVTISEFYLTATGSLGTAMGSTGPTEARFGSIGSQTSPFISSPSGYVAHFSGLNVTIPTGGAGTNVDFHISYPAINTFPINASGTTSQFSPTFVNYTSSGGMSSTMCPAGGGCTVIMNPVSSPTMMLVGSKPTITLSQPTNTLINGLVELADIAVSADTQGDVKINTLPVLFMGSNASVATSANSIIVKDSTGTIIPTTNTAFMGGVALVNFTGGYQITAGQTKLFKIFNTVSGVSGTAGTSMVSTALSSIASMSWTDVAGGNNTPFTTSNSTYFYNYPTNMSVVHN